MKNALLTFAFALTLIIVCCGTSVMGQTYLSSTEEFYLTNKLSNKVMDVRGNSKIPGTEIWQHNINYTEAQTFRLFRQTTYGNDTYTVVPTVFASPSLRLSLKHNLGSNAPAKPDSDVVGELPTVVLGNPQIETNGTESNTFKVIQDIEYRIKPIFTAVSPLSSQPRYQIWRFIPVPNEQDTYIIESAAFTERMVLQPVGTTSGSPLRISRFTGGDIQKWIVRRTTPERPTNVVLRDFVWKDKSFLWFSRGKLKGGLEWADNSSNEDGFRIHAKRKDDGVFRKQWVMADLGPNTVTYVMNESSRYGNGKEHCFRVVAYNKWGSASSDETCAIPSVNQPPPPPPPPPAGVESIAIFNCHSERKTVRIWTYDLTVNNGSWEDRGTVSSSWVGSSCPENSLPLKFSLTDGHSYNVKAIDCGDEPPNLTDGTCHKATYGLPILGRPGGGTKVLIVNACFDVNCPVVP